MESKETREKKTNVSPLDKHERQEQKKKIIIQVKKDKVRNKKTVKLIDK